MSKASDIQQPEEWIRVAEFEQLVANGTTVVKVGDARSLFLYLHTM